MGISAGCDARARNVKANVGLVFGIVVEKNHELPEHDPKRKYKGRAVFQGNNVWDEEGNWAVFQELGSCPATMEAARCADPYGLMPGHSCATCGRGASIHASRDRRHPDLGATSPRAVAQIMGGYVRPCLPTQARVYGHPDSGGHWEAHCAKHLRRVGFTDIDPLRSCFWHKVLRRRF